MMKSSFPVHTTVEFCMYNIVSYAVFWLCNIITVVFITDGYSSILLLVVTSFQSKKISALTL